MILQIASSSLDRTKSDILAKALRKEGYEIWGVEGDDIDPKEIVILLLTSSTDKEDLLSTQTWLAKQFDYSSFKGFRLMPLLIYSSSKEDPEEICEGPFGEMMEELISGEFKPFGWDLDFDGNIKEFKRVLEESYSE